MNLKQLEAFIHVAEAKSFSKAAKELFLTQPTISAHIASLEKELNVRLFVRNTKEVNLSKDGDLLYSHAREMVDLEKEIRQLFSVDSKNIDENLSVAASTIPSQYILPEILGRFREKYPKIQLRITETDSTKVIEKIVNQEVEIGFSGTILEKKHCKYIPFCKDELVIITPNTASYQERKKDLQEYSWLQDSPLILREEGSGTRLEAEKILKKMGFAMDSLNVVATIENQETIKNSVANGVGISIISKLATIEEVKAGRLLRIELPKQGSDREICLVYNKNNRLSLQAQKLISVVKEVT